MKIWAKYFYAHSGNNLCNNWLNTVFWVIYCENTHVWPPGLTTNIIKGYYKALHLVSNVYNFISNASFWVFGIFQKPKIAENRYSKNIFNKIKAFDPLLRKYRNSDIHTNTCSIVKNDKKREFSHQNMKVYPLMWPQMLSRGLQSVSFYS